MRISLKKIQYIRQLLTALARVCALADLHVRSFTILKILFNRSTSLKNSVITFRHVTIRSICRLFLQTAHDPLLSKKEKLFFSTLHLHFHSEL